MLYRVKTAKARWQKELDKLQGLPEALSTFRVPEEVERQLRYSADVLTPTQLKTQLKADLRAHYGQTGNPLNALGHLSIEELQASAQRKLLLDRKLVDHYVRNGLAVKYTPPVGPLNMAGMIFLDADNLSEFARRFDVPKESIPTFARSILQHERAEGVALGNVLSGLTPSSSNASHAGVLPVLAERAGIQDLATLNAMSRMRQSNPEDAATARILKQHGQVGNYVLPFGGKAHRSAEKQVRNRVDKPELLPMQMQRSFSSNKGTSADFIAHSSAIPSGTRAERLAVKTKGLITPKRLVGAALATATLAPALYAAYRSAKAREEEKTRTKSASAPLFLGAQLFPPVYSMGSEYFAVQAAKRNGVIAPDRSFLLDYALPVGAAALTYGGLAHKYPKTSPLVRALAASMVGGFTSIVLASGTEAELAARTQADAARRLQQAKAEGQAFTNYYVDPSGEQKGYNKVIQDVASGEQVPWYRRHVLRGLENFTR